MDELEEIRKKKLEKLQKMQNEQVQQEAQAQQQIQQLEMIVKQVFTKEALYNIANITMNNIFSFYNNKGLENEICYQCINKNCKNKIKGRCF